MAFDIDQNNYRVKRDSSKEEEMRYLVNDLKLFKNLGQLIMVCAVIGYNNNKYRPFEKSAEAVQLGFFTKKSYDMMNFIAYASKKDQSVLKDNNQFKYLEYYANGGFPILIDKLQINFEDRSKNDRNKLLLEYYSLLKSNSFYE